MVASFDFISSVPYGSYIDPSCDLEIIAVVNALRASNPGTAYACLIFHVKRTVILCNFFGLRSKTAAIFLKKPTGSTRPLHGNILIITLKNVADESQMHVIADAGQQSKTSCVKSSTIFE